ALLHEAQEKGEFLTGLIYVEPSKKDFLSLLGMPDQPLASMTLEQLRPGPEALAEIMEHLR
ncbi:MAG: 2-oxoacid:ferredoxin oxidoreductase subunit beta, partial [Acidobacteriota bacterium]|nr:2-oxoacid:ferredoxin oxidoreductase subunit beta [Acidobacteriota bacterium]